jgi:hypothetical protein
MKTRGILQADDIEAGMLVTIFSWKPLELSTPSDYSPVLGAMVQRQTFCGVPFFVLGINLPFAHLELVNTTNRFYADLRQCTLMGYGEEMLIEIERSWLAAERIKLSEGSLTI